METFPAYLAEIAYMAVLHRCYHISGTKLVKKNNINAKYKYLTARFVIGNIHPPFQRIPKGDSSHIFQHQVVVPSCKTPLARGTGIFHVREGLDKRLRELHCQVLNATNSIFCTFECDSTRYKGRYRRPAKYVTVKICCRCLKSM